MKRIIVFFSVILAAVLQSAYSANVTIVAEGVFSDYSDPDGLLPFSEPAPGTIFTMEFTYDDATRDRVPLPYIGSYDDAISAAKLVIGGSAFGGGESNNIIIILNDIEATNSSDNSVTYTDLWGASSNTLTPDADPAFVLTEGFSMNLLTNLLAPPVPPLSSIELTKPMWPSDWDIGFISYGISRFPAAGSGLSETLASAGANITSISVIPIPSAVWLLGSALGLLGGVRQRTR